MGIRLKSDDDLMFGDKPLNLSGGTTPNVATIKKFLDSAPESKLFNAQMLSAETKMGRRSIKDLGTHPDLDRYTHKSDVRIADTYRFWGNPKAIEKLQAKLRAKVLA